MMTESENNDVVQEQEVYDETISVQNHSDTVLRKKRLKKNKAKRILFRIFIGVAFLAVLFIGAFGLIRGIRSGYFDVKHIAVVGNNVVDRQTVIEAAKIPVNTCIFAADLNRVYQNINENIDCQHLIISRKFPDTVVINVSEQPAFFAMIENDTTYYLDYDFRLIESSDYIRSSDLPIISGLTGASGTPTGKKAELEPVSRAEELKTMMTIIANGGCNGVISEYVASSDGTYKIITKNNLVIKIKDADQFKGNYDYIAAILRKNKSNLDVDLTQGDKPVVKNR